MPSGNTVLLLTLQPVCISFSCIIVLHRPFQHLSTILKKSGKNGQAYCSFSLDALYPFEEIPFYSVFIMRACWIFLKCFFCICWDSHVILLLIWCLPNCPLFNVWMLNRSCTWLLYIIPSYIAGFGFLFFCWGFLCVPFFIKY